MISYEKNTNKKNRLTITSGPRDNQSKKILRDSINYDNSELVKSLKDQIILLQNELDMLRKNNSYQEDTINNEIIKAVKEETLNLRKQLIDEKDMYETTLKTLEKEVSNMKVMLLDRDNTIEDLRAKEKYLNNNVTSLIAEVHNKLDALPSKIGSSNVLQDIKPEEDNRPTMEVVFVDPLEKESKIESYIKTEEVLTSEKESLETKKNKLKNLLGKKLLDKE